VTSQDVQGFMNDVAAGKTAGKTKTAKKRGLAHVRGGKGTASRTVGLLGGIFTYAIKHGMRSDNPVRGVDRFADGVAERRLSESEYQMLGRALQAAQAELIWPAAIAAMRFLTLTGWRSGEVLALRWRDVDLVRRVAILRDTKTGRSERALSLAACETLRPLTRTKDDNLVFPPTRGDGVMSGFRKLFDRIAKLGGLPKDITPKTLRHSFASEAAELQYSEITIGELIGHRGDNNRITKKHYVHVADKVLLAAADEVAAGIVALMEGRAERRAA
jgi:integrase